jgi:hypothetical protein
METKNEPHNRAARRRLQRHHEKIQRALQMPASKRDVAVAVNKAMERERQRTSLSGMMSRLWAWLNQRVRVAPK